MAFEKITNLINQEMVFLEREATLVDILIDSGSIVVMLLIVRIFFLIKLRLLRRTEEEIN